MCQTSGYRVTPARRQSSRTEAQRLDAFFHRETAMHKTPDAKGGQTRADAQQLRGGSSAHYRDRPTDDGMKGDGADEPNAGSPKLPRQGPSRRRHQQRGAR